MTARLMCPQYLTSAHYCPQNLLVYVGLRLKTQYALLMSINQILALLSYMRQVQMSSGSDMAQD